MAIDNEYITHTWKRGDKLTVGQMNAISKTLDTVENEVVAKIPQLEEAIANVQASVEQESAERSAAIEVMKNEIVEQVTNGLDNDTIDGIKEVVTAYQRADEGIKTLINTNSGKISALEEEVAAVKQDVSDIVVPDVSEFAKIEAVTQQIETTVAPISDSLTALQEEVGGLKETSVSWVDFEYEGQDRKTIQLPNYDSISGVDTDGNGHNLVMLSKWNVADFGSPSVHANINTSDALTINDNNVVATVSQEAAQAAGSTMVYLQAEADEKFALKSEIPSVDSFVTADALEPFATKEALAAVEARIPEIPSHAEYALKSELPTKVSQLENDSGFLTEHQSLENLATKQDVADLDGSLTQIIETNAREADEKFALKDSVQLIVNGVEQEIADNKAEAEAKFALKSELPSLEGLASEAFVENKIASVVDGAPEALNTLKELADELNNKGDAVAALVQRIAELESRVAELEAKVGNPATEDEPEENSGE